MGVNIGIEIDGKGIDFVRPAVIIKKLNKEHAWILPITGSKLIKSGMYIKIDHPLLDEDSVVILTQPHTISSKRLMKVIGILPDDQFKEIVKSLKNIFP